MTDEKASDGQRILAGILFMCGAGLLFPVMSGFAKFLGEDGYSSLQVSWARAFGHIVFMMAVFVPKFGLGMLRTRRPVIQLMRSAMLFMSNATNLLRHHLHPARQDRLDQPDGAAGRGAARLGDAGRAHDASAGWWRWARASSAC